MSLEISKRVYFLVKHGSSSGLVIIGFELISFFGEIFY